VSGVARALGWWATLPFRLGWSHPVRVGLVLVLVVGLHTTDHRDSSLGLALGCFCLVLVLRVSWWTCPASFERFLAGPYRRRQIKRHLRKAWPQLMERSGLTFVAAATKSGEHPTRHVPRLQAAHWRNMGPRK
jgi:hypothetical protein